MSDGYRREDDRIAARVEQKLDDFIRATERWQIGNDRTSVEWREAIDRRLEPVEEFVRNAKWSYRLMIGILGGLSALVAVALKLVSYWKNH